MIQTLLQPEDLIGQFHLPVSHQRETPFPESTVVLVRASANQLNRHIFSLNVLSELRRAKELADFFTGMSRNEQADWVLDLNARLRPSDSTSPVVCLLDTGVNNNHPLLAHSLADDDMHAYEPAWGVTDTRRHGTEMAGLALYGDLLTLLVSQEEILLSHKLESVKILPPTGANKPELYGDITRESIARAEVQSPHRKRVICLTTSSTTDFGDRGQPSSWSSAVDQICAEAIEGEENHKLVLIAAGNTNPSDRNNYPHSNTTDEI